MAPSRFIKFPKPGSPEIRLVWEEARLRNLRPELLGRFLRFMATHHPPKLGPQHKSPLELSVRGINLLLLGRSARLGKVESWLWRTYLGEHYKVVRRNPEAWDPPTNHYLVNLLFLWLYEKTFGLDFRETEELLAGEFRGQFREDGSHHEDATGYWAMCIEALLLFLALGGRGELRCLAETALRAYLSFSPHPVICDWDGGGITRPDGVDYPEYLLGLARLAGVRTPRPEEGLTLAGELAAVRRGDRVLTVVVRTLPGPKGHHHCHPGSVTLFWERWWLVDPGSPTYTGDRALRDLTRSVRVHNTVWPLGWDCRFRGYFSPSYLPQVKLGEAKERRLLVSWEGITREMVLDEDKISVSDRGGGTLRWGLTLAPGVKPERTSRGLVLSDGRARLLVEMRPRIPVWVLEVPYSRELGSAEATLRVEGEFGGGLDWSLYRD